MVGSSKFVHVLKSSGAQIGNHEFSRRLVRAICTHPFRPVRSNSSTAVHPMWFSFCAWRSNTRMRAAWKNTMFLRYGLKCAFAPAWHISLLRQQLVYGARELDGYESVKTRIGYLYQSSSSTASRSFDTFVFARTTQALE